jgi:hypothetical protein
MRDAYYCPCWQQTYMLVEHECTAAISNAVQYWCTTDGTSSAGHTGQLQGTVILVVNSHSNS